MRAFLFPFENPFYSEVSPVKTALCSFSASSSKFYSYIIPPDLEQSLKVDDKVIVPTKHGEAVVYVKRIEKKRNPEATVTILRLAESEG